MGIAPICGTTNENNEQSFSDTEESEMFTDPSGEIEPSAIEQDEIILDLIDVVDVLQSDEKEKNKIKKQPIEIKESTRPTNIHEALTVQTEMLRETIIDILVERPKYSCVKEKLTAYVLQKWGIRSRGKPREKFSYKVNKAITYLDREGYVEIYKSKNVRVRLGRRPYPRQMKLTTIDRATGQSQEF